MTQLEPDREPIPDDVPEGAGGLTDDPDERRTARRPRPRTIRAARRPVGLARGAASGSASVTGVRCPVAGSARRRR
jgi:hypothetical protein